jgi:MFS family permease
VVRVLRVSRSAYLLTVETVLLVLFTAAAAVELPYVKHSLEAGDAGYGTLLTAWGAGMVGGSVAFATLSRASLPVLAGAATLAVGVSYAVMGVAPSLLVACAGAVLGGAGNGVQWVAVVSLVQRRAPAELGWRVTAVLESIAALAPGIGFLLGGLAVTAFDPRTCLLALAAAIATVAAVAALPSLGDAVPQVSNSGRRVDHPGALHRARRAGKAALEQPHPVPE